ncbi:hypothetical protein IBTHAUMO2_170038 [Nitrosopumilaceae archaeon]|nr:DUF3800 domain-containing protein [Nitrosopumilus sp.]CAI9831103.1 hypothetical protein IBTHAUMO2_170038 [Nitrosopumilaceae archaeon]MDA7941191.1 DUF3800 domain-containing protein [Nitrosopumilus sp.]MDA7942411.1 DUF3800 domain-containing protein [Nitrosopumilus sp.]MDA7944868.1 DUF3800 domain-containing protein [Nitrosopumilus sp.]
MLEFVYKLPASDIYPPCMAVYPDDSDLFIRNGIDNMMDECKINGYEGRKYTRKYYENLTTYGFSKSEEHAGIQLADMCCGAVAELIQHGDARFFRQLRDHARALDPGWLGVYPGRFRDRTEQDRLRGLLDG